jgi:cation transport ATPase
VKRKPEQPAAAPSPSGEVHRKLPLVIAGFALAGISVHLTLRWWPGAPPLPPEAPLLAVLVAGGIPLVIGLLAKLVRKEIGADLLAGISIVTAAVPRLRRSSDARAEARAIRAWAPPVPRPGECMPKVAHRRRGETLEKIALDAIAPGDEIVVLPHEVCPVDGRVVAGHGAMDESYLTGEPYVMSKAPGSDVLSGAVNGESVLTIRATRLAKDSRYAEIMEVMRRTEESRPRLRRLGDSLGAFYTPLALLVAGGPPVRGR